MRYLILALTVSGCATAPLVTPVSPDDTALHDVWEVAYGMPRELRPDLSWWDGCLSSFTPSSDGWGGVGSGSCIVAIFGHDRVELQRSSSIASSALVIALKNYQIQISRGPLDQGYSAADDQEMGKAKAALLSDGL